MPRNCGAGSVNLVSGVSRQEGHGAGGHRQSDAGEEAGDQRQRARTADSAVGKGVADNCRRGGRSASQGSKVEAQVFIPAAQTGLYPVGLSDFAIRTSGTPLSTVKAVQNEVWAI